MPKGYNFRPLVQSIIEQTDQRRAESAVVHSLDGNHANIRIGNSSTLIRNVAIVGDVSLVTVGSTVALAWINDRPIIMSGASGSVAPSTITSSNTGIAVDNDTLERSSRGLRVKQGGIDLKHLSFTPALSGHSHKDSLQRGGWIVSDNGVIFNNRTYISPDGSLTLGEAPQIIRLSSIDETYRIWAGTQQGEAAPFSVDKYGKIIATAGAIGGWFLDDDSLSSDSQNAELNSSTPHIQLGGRSFGSGSGFWVGKDVDSVYKLALGDSENYLVWDGSGLVLSGEIRIGAADYDSGEGFWVGDDGGTYKLRVGSETQYLRWTGSALEMTGNISIGASGYMTGEGFWAGLDDGDYKFFVGDSEEYVLWDGSNLFIQGTLQSSNFIQGLSGWQIAMDGSAEFSNVDVRGRIKTSVIEREQVVAVDGGMIIAKAACIVKTDAAALSTDFDVELSIPEGVDSSSVDGYFNAGDVVRIKSGNTSMWADVVLTLDMTTHWLVTLSKIDPTEDVDILAGMTLFNYGALGNGVVEIDGGYPRIRLYTHEGDPYDNVAELLTIGNLGGGFGVDYGVLGFGLGDPNRLGNYLIATSEGIELSGVIHITDGTGIYNLGDAGNLAGQDSVDWDTQVDGDTKPEDNATYGADWGTGTLTGIPDRFNLDVGNPTSDGLYLTSEYLGFYNAAHGWKTYMDASGRFRFAGSGGAYIGWDPDNSAGQENRLYGSDGEIVQWYASAEDGKIHVGGGSVSIDYAGIKIIGDNSAFYFVQDESSDLPVGTLRIDKNVAEEREIRLINGLDNNDINLVSNPSFETDTSGWTLQGTVTPERSLTFGYDGSCSVRFPAYVVPLEGIATTGGDTIVSTSGDRLVGYSYAEEKYGAIISDEVPVISGNSYEVNLAIYYPNSNHYQLSVYANIYNSAMTYVRRVSLNINGLTPDSWSIASTVVGVNSGESYIKIEVKVDQGYGVFDDPTPGEIYIDFASVYQLGSHNSQLLLGEYRAALDVSGKSLELTETGAEISVPLALPAANPTSDYEAAHKKYVDEASIASVYAALPALQGAWAHDTIAADHKWQDYTPTWDANTTDPSLGNGTLTGRYVLHGKTCTCKIFLKIGSTTDLGSGIWLFGLPIDSLANYTGSVIVFDSSTADRYSMSVVTAASNRIWSIFGESKKFVTPASPMAWGTDDILYLSISYEVA